MPAAKIFITGASGYVGGSVLTTLLKYPNKYTISSLIRNPNQADCLVKLGVTPVLGDLDDTEVIFKSAKNSDAVVHTAGDHMAGIEAIVRGLKAKKDKKAVLLHTSGTSILTYSGGTIDIPFDDKDIERLHSIPANSPHKVIDTWIFENTEDITAAIIAPSTTHGIGLGPFKKSSHLVPKLVRSAIERKLAGWVGARSGVIRGNVNINDLAELYHLVLGGLLSNSVKSGKEGGWYFGSTHEYTWAELAEGIGQILYKKGLVDSPAISRFEDQYADKYFLGEAPQKLWEGDSRCIANRSKEIGWKPRYPNIHETLEQEIDYFILQA